MKGFIAVSREIKIGKLLEHPHIIRLYENIETMTDIYVVMEYAERGELFDYIVENRRIREDEARKFFQQVVIPVSCCIYLCMHQPFESVYLGMCFCFPIVVNISGGVFLETDHFGFRVLPQI